MNENDSVAMKLIAEVEKRKKEIKAADNPRWKTNANFYTNPEFPSVNQIVSLHVEANIEKLVALVAGLTARREGYEKAAKLLEVESAPPFSYLGFSYDDWIHDFKARIKKIQIGEQKKKLEALEARLNAIVSPEQKAKLELQAIMDELA